VKLFKILSEKSAGSEFDAHRLQRKITLQNWLKLLLKNQQIEWQGFCCTSD